MSFSIAVCLIPWRQDVSLNPKFINLARLVSQPVNQDLSVFTYPMFGLQACVAVPGFYKGDKSLNSCPHICIANTATHRSALQPQCTLLG